MYKYEGNPKVNYYKNITPHIKIGILTDKDMEIDDDTVIYFGSHNFSKGAW